MPSPRELVARVRRRLDRGGAAAPSSPEDRRILKRLSGALPAGTEPELLPLHDAEGISLYVTSKVERRSRVHALRKEPWTARWLREDVGPGDVVYDVGANVGAYALLAGRRVGPHGRVFAFEPGYASYARLCDNLVVNRLGDVVVPVPLPLGRQSRLAEFAYKSLAPGHARHAVAGERAEDAAPLEDPVFVQQVLVAGLDDLRRTFGLPQPRHVKIDVDGWEVEVLAGAAVTLASPELRTLVIEVEAPNGDAVVELLARAGLSLSDRHQREVDGRPVPWWFGVFRR